METKREHRRLDLTPEEWQRLETLAAKTSSRPRSGVNAHQPDWRALIKRIASGDVLVNEANPNPHIARIDEALAKLHDPEQEPPRKYRQLSILEAA